MEHLYRRYCRSVVPFARVFCSFRLVQYLLVFNRFHVETQRDLFSLPVLSTPPPCLVHLFLSLLIRLPYLSCICLIVSSYCTVFFPLYLRTAA